MSGDKSQWIKRLFLQHNELTTIPKGAFDGLIHIQHIFLNNNNIHIIDSYAFAETNNASIYLFNNNIEIIENQFGNFTGSKIHIYGNKIKKIYSVALMSFHNRTIIYMTCQSLTETPWAPEHVQINCVSPAQLPNFTFGSSLPASALKYQGFECNNTEAQGIHIWTCRLCPPGRYSAATYGCKRCPAGGFYQDEIGKAAPFPGGVGCKMCNNGTFVQFGAGATSEQCQVCPDGTDQTKMAGFRACSCKKYYARIKRFGPCELCHEPGLNCTQHDYKALLPGYCWSWTFPSANITHYQLFVQNMLVESASYNSDNSEYNLTIPKVYECPHSANCGNKESFTAANIEGKCSVGYTGWLCTKCQARYYMVLNTCIPCPGKVWMIVEIVLLVGCCALFCFIVAWRSRRSQQQTRTERPIMDITISRMKILLGFYQVVGELVESLHDIKWTGFLQIIGEFISGFEMNVFRIIVRPQCYNPKLSIDPKVEFLIGVSLPLAIVGFGLCFYLAVKGCHTYKSKKDITWSYKNDGKILKVKDTLYTLVMVSLFVTYPPICTVIFQMYPRACKIFCLDHQNQFCFSLLRSDYDIDCKYLSHYQNAAFVATACYVVAYPCLLFYLLCKYCYKVHSTTTENSLQERDETIDERTRLISESSVRLTVPVWLHFLCENYDPDYWYWDIIELTRKVTQTVLITLLGWEDRLTVILTIGMSVLFLTLHARFWPMKDIFEQRLQMFSLTAIFINVLTAAITIPNDYETAVNTFLVILNVSLILLIAGDVLLVLARKIKRLKPDLGSIFTIRLRRKRSGPLELPQEEYTD